MWRLLGTVAKEKRGLVKAVHPETRLLWGFPLQNPSRTIWGGSTETGKWHASGSASFAWSEAHSSIGCSWAKPQGRHERPQGTVNTRERRQYPPFQDPQYSFWKHPCWKDSRERTLWMAFAQSSKVPLGFKGRFWVASESWNLWFQTTELLQMTPQFC